VGWYESIAWIVRTMETCDFIEVRCRQTGVLLGTLDNMAVPGDFLRGSPTTRLMVVEGYSTYPELSPEPRIISESAPVMLDMDLPPHTIVVERMTFEWREPHLGYAPAGSIAGRLLLTFMMVDQDDISSLANVVGFRPVGERVLGTPALQ